jgi:hypothetical protein
MEECPLAFSARQHGLAVYNSYSVQRLPTDWTACATQRHARPCDPDSDAGRRNVVKKGTLKAC